MLNPWVLLGALLAALGSFGSGYWFGSGNAETKCVAGQVETQQAAVVAADTESSRREALGTDRETTREQIRIVYRNLKQSSQTGAIQVAASGVAAAGASCALTADGLRLWNAANSGIAAPLPSEPDSGLPGTATGALGDATGSAQQPYRGDGAVRPMPGSVEQAGAMYRPEGGAKP